MDWLVCLVLICANCHRRRTAKRAGFIKLTLMKLLATPLTVFERVTGIEPASPAWKAGALPLSYTRR